MILSLFVGISIASAATCLRQEAFLSRLQCAIQVKRRQFCNLVLATLTDSEEQTRYRLYARDLGASISTGQFTDPSYWYMEIIDAARRPTSTADFGDVNPHLGQDSDLRKIEKRLGLSVLDSWDRKGFIGKDGFLAALECDELFRD
jgi:hypothetical protein